MIAYRIALVGLGFCCGIATSLAGQPASMPEPRVGPLGAGQTLVPNGQFVEPAGTTIAYAGRPFDLCLSPDRSRLYVKNANSLAIFDTGNWSLRQVLPITDDYGSMHGIAAAPGDDPKTTRVYVTCAKQSFLEAETAPDGTTRWLRRIALPGPSGKYSHALGLALLNRDRVCVCLSRNNSLAILDLKTGRVEREIPVGVCPYSVVVMPGDQFAYVSNFGGPRAKAGVKTAISSGTPVEVDERGISLAGTVSKIDLASNAVVNEITVGLHPAQILLDRAGGRLFVANANSDSVSVIDTATDKVIDTIDIRPHADLPFGSIVNALALSADETILYCANAGNNAIAVVHLGDRASQPGKVAGFIPTGWFPGGIVCDGKSIYVANTKGEGSRQADPKANKRNSKEYRGSVSKVSTPSDPELTAYTARALAAARVPRSFPVLADAARSVEPVPVPARIGEPSVFKHIVYVIKENRTYDQVFGDLPKGNGDPKLCIYGRQATPNQHALAEQFALLDNYYCNGVVSADGHQWATQGIVTDYQEKDFGGWTRSYDFGTDALCYASSNFIWDSAVLNGLSFRNYGEFDFPSLINKNATWFDIRAGQVPKGAPFFKQSVAVDALKRFTCSTYPGWLLKISDQYRMDMFLKEFAQFEREGNWQNLVIVYLPQDHTSGTGSTVPTPRAFVADNDLAVGRLVEAISKSRFWPQTCIFINEDDPQDGFDHVDGHRSTCLVISPYTRRGTVVHHFYNQTSVLHTMCRMLGLPPMNQLVAAAPTMEDCFTGAANLEPYQCLPNQIPLDERNKTAASLAPEARELAARVNNSDWSHPDRVDDEAFNRLLWMASGRSEPYPALYAGPHARGLKPLGLKLDATVKKDKDDD